MTGRLYKEIKKTSDKDDGNKAAQLIVVAKSSPPTQAQSLRRHLEETSRDLAAAQAGFDQTADRDLLEYYLYEISALRAKHTYLLRQMKSLETEATS